MAEKISDDSFIIVYMNIKNLGEEKTENFKTDLSVAIYQMPQKKKEKVKNPDTGLKTGIFIVLLIMLSAILIYKKVKKEKMS